MKKIIVTILIVLLSFPAFGQYRFRYGKETPAVNAFTSGNPSEGARIVRLEATLSGYINTKFIGDNVELFVDGVYKASHASGTTLSTYVEDDQTVVFISK